MHTSDDNDPVLFVLPNPDGFAGLPRINSTNVVEGAHSEMPEKQHSEPATIQEQL